MTQKIAVGSIAFLIIAAILVSGFKYLFVGEMPPEGTALIAAGEQKQKALEDLTKSLETGDVERMNAALSKYKIMNARAIESLEKACQIKEIKIEIAGECSQLELSQICDKADIQNLEYIIQLNSPGITKSKCTTLYDKLLEYKQTSECTKLPGADIEESVLSTISRFCNTL